MHLPSSNLWPCPPLRPHFLGSSCDPVLPCQSLSFYALFLCSFNFNWLAGWEPLRLLWDNPSNTPMTFHFWGKGADLTACRKLSLVKQQQHQRWEITCSPSVCLSDVCTPKLTWNQIRFRFWHFGQFHFILVSPKIQKLKAYNIWMSLNQQCKAILKLFQSDSACGGPSLSRWNPLVSSRFCSISAVRLLDLSRVSLHSGYP